MKSLSTPGRLALASLIVLCTACNESQFRIGNMYAEGNFVSQDDAEAARWYRKGAEDGHSKCQAALVRHRKPWPLPRQSELQSLPPFVIHSLLASSR